MSVKHYLKTDLTACYLDDCLYLSLRCDFVCFGVTWRQASRETKLQTECFPTGSDTLLMVLTPFIPKGQRMRHKCSHRKMSL